MAFIKIPDVDINEAKIASILGDQMTGTADENKAKFDELPMLAVNAINVIIDKLTGNSTDDDDIVLNGDMSINGVIHATEIDADTIHFDDSDVVKDANYVHTDNNLTNARVTLLNDLRDAAISAETLTAFRNIGYEG